MEQQVGGSGDGMALAGVELAKRMQLGGTRLAEKAVPGIRSERCDAGEPSLNAAKIDRAKYRRQIDAERAYSWPRSSRRLA